MSHLYFLPRLPGQVLDEPNVRTATEPAVLVSGVAFTQGVWRLEFDVELTEGAVANLLVLLAANNPNDGPLFARARQALDTNDAYLLLDPPTQVQAVEQVEALTRQVTALIRLALREAGQ